MRHLRPLLCSFLVSFFPFSASSQRLTQYVDPTIGSGDHGHVFIGANVPFGLVNAGPTQIEHGWDWCSGYHYSGSKIVGFAQTHLSGTGCSDLGDIAIMPAVEDIPLSREGMATDYCHDNEAVSPGYYRVLTGTSLKVSYPADSLPANVICTEITATQHTALYRITYPQGARRQLVVDLENGVGDHVLWGRLTQIDPYTYVGYRISHGWANRQHIYFAMRLNQKGQLSEQSQMPGALSGGPSPVSRLRLADSGRPLLVRIALSPVSEANALANMNAEASADTAQAWDFDAVREAAENKWDEELGRVKASFVNDRDRRIFYTSMYHFMVAPQIWDDVNGDWRGADNHVYRNPFAAPRAGQPQARYLTTLSLWDTYRAAAPLSTIILPEMMPSVAETYLRIFREQGKLPVWHLMSQETDCMVGCPAVPILADLLLKGFVRDSLAAWNAIRSSLLMDERGLDDMKRLGYVSSENHEGSLSMSLEYMLAFWSAAQAGKAIMQAGRGNAAVSDDVAYFEQRSHLYKNLYDPRVGFMRSRNAKGDFGGIENFNPAFQTKDYTEGNPWQYLWLVPHDVQGLVEMLGGRDQALTRLDGLFSASSQLNAEANPDITGLIGQYAHGNEPSHHIAYLYTLMGKPGKTAAIVRRIMRELYTDQPAGLCGNEDVGQMSAWFILSALGFYPVEPCGGNYVVGSPLVKEADVYVGDGRTLHIRTHNNNDRNICVKKVIFNGKAVTGGIIRHADIVKGGTLDFYMGRPAKGNH
ncbi:MAG: GH92 family glycosyl hydrolase [Bacteroidaceae bacterium]|nr:GH92 family glycosyl hydrolase [Bacteroidaceae bacterium]